MLAGLSVGIDASCTLRDLHAASWAALAASATHKKKHSEELAFSAAPSGAPAHTSLGV